MAGCLAKDQRTMNIWEQNRLFVLGFREFINHVNHSSNERSLLGPSGFLGSHDGSRSIIIEILEQKAMRPKNGMARFDSMAVYRGIPGG